MAQWFVETRTRTYGPYDEKRHAENKQRQLKKYHKASSELVQEV